MGGKLVLITNSKSYMSFRLVPKSVSLNDLERRNGPYFAFFTELGSFRSPSFSSADESLLWKYGVGRRFVALSLIMLYLCFPCNRMDFLNVKR